MPGDYRMDSVSEPRRLAEIARHLRADPLVVAAFALFLISVGVYAAPWLSDALRRTTTEIYLPVLFIGLVAIACFRGLSRLPRVDERIFWASLGLGFTAWLLVPAAVLIDRDLATATTAPFYIFTEICYGIYYTLIAHALSRRPHRPQTAVSGWRGRLLAWPAGPALVTGGLVYFAFIPLLTDPAVYATALPSLVLYILLDLYLTYLAMSLRHDARSPRWRLLYALLMSAFGILTILDLIELEVHLGGFQWLWTHFGAAIWNVPQVLLVVAASLRHAPLDIADDERPETLRESSWQTLTVALLLPIVHVGLSALGVIAEATRTARELWIFVWLLGLGAVALFQHRVQDGVRRRLQAGNVSLNEEILWRQQVETERRRLIAELEARQGELERFTYTMSHDLKNPLVTIQAFVGALEKDLEAGREDRARTDLARVRAAAVAMNAQLDQMIEMSELGHRSKSFREVDLADAVREALRRLRGPIDEGRVEVEIAADLPPVYGEAPRIFELVFQLLENAVLYLGDQQAPRVEIGARPSEDGVPIVYVRDNGIGIEPRYQERIFEIFERLDPANAFDDVAHAGVGLTRARRIVEVHDGRLWVESEGRGRGSTFCFTLPRRTPAES